MSDSQKTEGQSEKLQRTLSGRVISDKMNKSAIVVIERQIQHPKYQKFIRRSTKFHIHDPENQCKEGDVVTIEQCRPVSKTKTWRLVNVVESNKAV